MLKILRILFSIIVIVLAGYSKISGNYGIMPYMMFFMGAMLLVMGIAEIKEARRKMGTFIIIASIFVFYVSLEAILLN